MRQVCLLLLIVAMTAHAGYGQGKIAIANVTIIDGTDHLPRPNSTVIVEGKRIAAITSARKEPPRGSKIIYGARRFLIPGLWNNDLHGPRYGDASASLARLLSYGVTTVRDMGAPLDDIVRVRDAIASGTLKGPRLFIAGPLMEGPVPVQMPLIVDLFSDSQAQDEIRYLKQHDVDYIEVDTTLTPELYWAIADEAKLQALPLVGHIPAKIRAEEIVKAHQVDVEHLGGRFLNILISCSRDEKYFDQIMRKTYDDLLTAAKERRPAEEPQFRADFDERLLSTFDESKAKRLYRLYVRNRVTQTPTLYVLNTLWQTNKDDHKLNDKDMDAGARIFAKDLEIVGEMKRAGVTILAGTDGPYSQGGDALHSELQLLVKAGLTPLQAIQAASRDAAEAMGISNDVGTIEVGKLADLVLLDADPLKDITNTRQINAVILHGEFFSKEQILSMRGE